MIDLIKKLAPYYKPYRTTVLLGLLFVILANAFKVLSPWVLRYSINEIESDISAVQLWQFAGMIVAVASVAGFFTYLMRKKVITVSREIEYDMRQKLLNHLLYLDPAFYDRSRIGDLMTRSTMDIEQVRMILGPGLMYTTNTIFGFLFAMILMFAISVPLTLIVITIGPIVAGIVFVIGRLLHKASRESQDSLSSLSALVQENLAGIRIVKAFRQHDEQERRFADQSQDLLDKKMKLVLFQGAFMPVIILLFGVAVAAIMLVGGWYIIQGTLRVGDYVAFTGYLMMLTWPMVSIGWVVSLVQRGRASMDRINELLDTQTELADPKNLETPESRTNASISFNDVSFTYPKSETPALRNIKFELEAGKLLGIVGRVGSGKSTITALISRLYDATDGSVMVNDVDVRKWSKNDLRKRIAIVPQDPLLFSTSIRDNITIGGDFSDDEVNRAVEISRLVQDLDSFPNGLDTEVGERGITLSGGQKQRVAIARAVIRDSEMLIFDDALSAVDAQTEEMILSNLNKYIEGRTAIIITHRTTSVHNADEIIVLADGMIVERGRHVDLIKAKGSYADLFRRQKMSNELDDA
ncbi:putative multidrug resistance ABC transporter ATP-binding/permease protein YheI [bacterium BMS3Bbin04]|nr:putative multidrug resistance ABC transporter ATP-binding/permease protein YheI [bacterium BMS3Bbin04]